LVVDILTLATYLCGLSFFLFRTLAQSPMYNSNYR
jgi:hypothetical protein